MWETWGDIGDIKKHNCHWSSMQRHLTYFSFAFCYSSTHIEREDKTDIMSKDWKAYESE